MLPTCYKLDLLSNRAFNDTFAAKPLTTNRGQDKIYSPWKDFFWMHRFLTLHDLHSLCSSDFIMTFTSQHQDMPSIHLLFTMTLFSFYCYHHRYRTHTFQLTWQQHSHEWSHNSAFFLFLWFHYVNFQLKILNSVNLTPFTLAVYNI
jgi:hypothetical protein